MAERTTEVARANRGAAPSLTSILPQPLQAAVSKPAQRAYIGSIFFLLIASILLGVSSVTYWLFYLNFVPQVSFERPVHLQFGNGDPFGTVALGAELVPLQAYDVSVALNLPRTPSNMEAGNFMVDLKVFPQSSGSYGSNAINLPSLVESRRPGILVYASPMVDITSRFSKLPFYVFGWKREAEDLRIMMMERVEFSKGTDNVPGSLRLEVQSLTRMQIYSATVRFDARFTGLRWVMYRWRILSFLTFSSAFWVVSMMVTFAVWMSLSSTPSVPQAPPSASDEGESDSVKSESEEEDIPPLSSGNNAERPRMRSLPTQAKDEKEEIKKEEDIEETTELEPLIKETGARLADDGPSASTQSQYGEGQAVRRRGQS